MKKHVNASNGSTDLMRIKQVVNSAFVNRVEPRAKAGEVG